MNKLDRFQSLISNSKVKKLCAFLLYVVIVIHNFQIPMPLILNILVYLIEAICGICLLFYLSDYLINLNGKINYIKEIAYFIIYEIIYIFISQFMKTGIPPDQLVLREIIYSSPVTSFFTIVVAGPMIEEICFRFVPSLFIDNKVLYILISSLVFALPHVLNDPNILYNIWPFFFSGMYLAYRYKKTNNIWVSIFIHSFKNCLAFISLLLF